MPSHLAQRYQRVQRLRQKRKQAGWQRHEVWLDPDTVALVERVKQPSESLHSVIRRALLTLEAQDTQEPVSEPIERPERSECS